MSTIDDLEERLEDLAEARERSRKFERGGAIGAWAGGALILLWLTGLVVHGPGALVAGVALALGGMVLAGSSRTTTQRLEAAIAELDAQRRSAIDHLQLATILPMANRDLRSR